MGLESRRARISAALVALLMAWASLVVVSAGAAAAASYPGVNGPIVFERDFDIWTIQPDGTALTNLTGTVQINEASPQLSPDGRAVVFVSGTGNENVGDIWVRDLVTGAEHRVSDPTGQPRAGDPSWSPDGTQIAYHALAGGTASGTIFVAQADGSGARQLTSGIQAGDVDWGTSGRIVVSTENALLTIDPTSGTVTTLHEVPGGTAVNPTWTPDGQSILFECRSGFGSEQVCRINADGSGPTTLTAVTGRLLHPSASPDGTRIVATQVGFDQGHAIVTLPITGGGDAEVTTVIDDMTVNAEPSWGPSAGQGPEPTPEPPPAGGGDPVVLGPALPPGGFDGDPATTERVDTPDPVGAAITISRARFDAPSGRGALDRQADWVVLSRDDTFPDSLAGSALTGFGPLLLTGTDALTPETGTEIRRVLAPGGVVYLLGGEGAISPAVEQSLTASGYAPRRLAGGSRVETAVAVATEVRRLGLDQGVVLLARAGGPVDNPTAAWADSVSAGGLAAFAGTPILITPTESLHPAVASWLAGDAPSATVLLGGTAALSTTVEQQVPNPQRIAGAERSETAVQLARQLWPDEEGQGYVVINGGDSEGWAFGLAAAGLAADAEAPVLLVGTTVPGPTAGELSTCGSPSLETVVVGAPALVPATVVAEIDRLDGQACDGGGAPPPPAPGGTTRDGTWVAEDQGRVLDLSFTVTGTTIGDVRAVLFWDCDGAGQTTVWTPEADQILVSGDSWSYEASIPDDGGTTTNERFSGTFTGTSTAEVQIHYDLVGNGSVCNSGDLSATAARS